MPETPQTPQAGEELGQRPFPAPTESAPDHHREHAQAVKSGGGFISLTRGTTLALLSIFTLAATGLAFALSFTALYEWAGSHGYEGWEQLAWPVIVDSFILIGELALFSLAIDGIRARGRKLMTFDVVFFVCLVAGGWIASLCFNVFRTGHDAGMGTYLTAAFPPALAMLGLFIFLRTVHRYTSGDHDAMMRARDRADQAHEARESKRLQGVLNSSEDVPQPRTEPAPERPQLPAQPEETEEAKAQDSDPEPEPDPDPEPPTPGPQGPGGEPLPDLSDPGAKKILVLSGLEQERGHVSRAIEKVKSLAPQLTVSEGYTHQIKREEWLPAKLGELLAEAQGEETRLRELITSGGFAINDRALNAFLSEQPRGDVRHLRIASHG